MCRIHSSLTSIQIFYKCPSFSVTFGSLLMSCSTWPPLTPPTRRNSWCFYTPHPYTYFFFFFFKNQGRDLIIFYFVMSCLKLEVTTFEILEELKVELRLRQLLWDSVQEWDSSQNGWRMVKLHLSCVKCSSANLNLTTSSGPNRGFSFADQTSTTERRSHQITDPEIWQICGSAGERFAKELCGDQT